MVMEEEAKLVPKNDSDNLSGRTSTSDLTDRSESILIGQTRPQYPLFLEISRPNIGRWLSALLFAVAMSAAYRQIVQRILVALTLIESFIKLSNDSGYTLVILLLLYLPRFISLEFFRRKDDEAEDIEGGLSSDEAVNTELVIQRHGSAADDSISHNFYFSLWERGKLIGAGAYGIVFVARNRKTRDLCVVKELKKIENAESMRKEIKILCKLKHPNIVKYYAHKIDEEGYISLYMEYIQPGSLKKYISNRGGLPETLIRKITAQILFGLAYLHSERVVHRDLKPDNILINYQEIVKLVDFGMSKHLAESVGNHSEIGTPYYAAPEVLQKIKYESSREAYTADVWSLGCVIIEMFSGKHPWPDCERQQVLYNVYFKKQSPPIPVELCQEGKDFLELCFIRSPADRPSAAALQDHPFVKPRTLAC